MGNRKRPETDRFVQAVKSLRLKNASLDEAKNTALRLYADNASKRSNFLRLFNASADYYELAYQQYEDGANLTEIVRCLPTTGGRGAPMGNLNASGNKQKSSLKHLIGAWNGANEHEKQEFTRMFGLKFS